MKRGTLLHEVNHLPLYWSKLVRNKMAPFKAMKFQFGTHRMQYGLYLKPLQPIKKVILYFHGGAWMVGRPEMYRYAITHFLEQGYAVFLPTHRRVPRHNFDDIRQDVNLATLAVFELLRKEELLDLPLILGGISSGGHLAASLFYDQPELEKLGFKEHPFSGLMTFAAPLDLSKMKWTPILFRLSGNKWSKRFAKASVINHLIEPPAKPVFGVHGTTDGLAAYQAGKSFFDKLSSLHPNLTTFRTLENGSHLDAIEWTHTNNQMRSDILEWLERIE